MALNFLRSVDVVLSQDGIKESIDSLDGIRKMFISTIRSDKEYVYNILGPLVRQPSPAELGRICGSSGLNKYGISMKLRDKAPITVLFGMVSLQ